MNLLNNWQSILYSLPGILLGLTFHEYCHALAAYKLGDTTARDEGRLTFNPLKHIDIIGFLFIIFAGFGWAKPVHFNPNNLRNYRRDKAIIAAAGPASNMVMAFLFIGLIRLWLHLYDSAWTSGNPDRMLSILLSEPVTVTISVLIQAAAINIGLMVFNLLPLPPLDGSHIFLSGLNLRPETVYRIMRIGAPMLFILIMIQNFTSVNILPIGALIRIILAFFIPELVS